MSSSLPTQSTALGDPGGTGWTVNCTNTTAIPGVCSCLYTGIQGHGEFLFFKYRPQCNRAEPMTKNLQQRIWFTVSSYSGTKEGWWVVVVICPQWALNQTRPYLCREWFEGQSQRTDKDKPWLSMSHVHIYSFTATNYSDNSVTHTVFIYIGYFWKCVLSFALYFFSQLSISDQDVCISCQQTLQEDTVPSQ